MEARLEKYFTDKKSRLDGALKRYFVEAPVSDKLSDAIRYSLFSEGKKFRPVLAMASCEAFGGKADDVLPFACALEMIHTYSLIHDDLPAMDNDDLRRGKPTNHKVFGEATAILAGDALLTLAFEIASRPVQDLATGIQLKIINEIAKASGPDGMVGGQQLDMDGESKSLKLEDIKRIHLHKTGKLIQCATTIGALCGKAGDGEIAVIRDYGDNLGLAFQITDDILDFTGKIPGKNPKGDIKNSKATFATILGIERSAELVKSAIEDAVKSLKKLDIEAEILEKIAVYIGDRIR